MIELELGSREPGARGLIVRKESFQINTRTYQPARYSRKRKQKFSNIKSVEHWF